MCSGKSKVYITSLNFNQDTTVKRIEVDDTKYGELTVLEELPKLKGKRLVLYC